VKIRSRLTIGDTYQRAIKFIVAAGFFIEGAREPPISMLLNTFEEVLRATKETEGAEDCG